MRPALLALAATLAVSATPTSAAVLATTVTATGGHRGDISVLSDGIFPAEGSSPFSSATVYGGREFGPVGTAFNFALDAPAIVTGFDLSVKGNDRYDLLFEHVNGMSTLFSILASEGRTTGGMERISRAISLDQPIRSVRITSVTGDGYYGLGEVQFAGRSVASAVPEPATWALMIGGFGIMGQSLRRRKRKVRISASC